MSYYDHATMMAHKLGPWADVPIDTQVPPLTRSRTGLSEVIRQALGRILPRLRGKTQAQNPDAAT